MAFFITRVMLHDGEADDYDALHIEMEWRKFSRIIVGNSGASWHLPWAEYYSFGNIPAEGVRDLASAAVMAIGRQAGILVCECERAVWIGLRSA